MITLDLRDAIAQAVHDLGQPADGLHPDPKLRPGPAPGTYATSIAFALSAISRTTPAQVAAKITRRLAAVAWISEAAVTGEGYVTITVTPEALASVAARITAAGPACVRSEVLRGCTVPRPFPATLEDAQTWEDGRVALAAELHRTARGGGGRDRRGECAAAECAAAECGGIGGGGIGGGGTERGGAE